ncbi:MAG: DUF4832 domain-containing protein [candidate division WOR-3 bacterium]
MKMLRARSKYLILWCIILLQPLCSKKHNHGPMVTVNPLENTDSIFANPGMGWQTFYRAADNDPNLAGLPTTTIYRRFSWYELEPTPGNFNFALFEDWLNRAKKNGQRLAWRLMIAASGLSSSVPLLGYAPLWLIDEGASGWIYYYDGNENNQQDPNEPDIWTPDLADSVTDYYHTRLVQEFARRYYLNPYLDIIDIGSVGLWGEWHFYATKIKQIVGNPPSGGTVGGRIPMYSEGVRKRIIDLWNQSFPSTPKVMLIGDSLGMYYATNILRTGWRADSWGDMNWHMPYFYDQQLQKTNATQAWKNGPVALEPGWNMEYWQSQGWDIDYILQWAIDHHASYIQNKSAVIPSAWIPKIKNALKKIGYRLVLREFQYPEYVYKNSPFEINMVWENTGSAPSYWDYYLYLQLRKEINNVLVKWDSPALLSIKGWLPGLRNEKVVITLPEELPTGEYDIYLGIFSPFAEHTHPNLKCIKLAIQNSADAEGWYLLSSIEVR